MTVAVYAFALMLLNADAPVNESSQQVLNIQVITQRFSVCVQFDYRKHRNLIVLILMRCHFSG